MTDIHRPFLCLEKENINKIHGKVAYDRHTRRGHQAKWLTSIDKRNSKDSEKPNNVSRAAPDDVCYIQNKLVESQVLPRVPAGSSHFPSGKPSARRRGYLIHVPLSLKTHSVLGALLQTAH